MSNELHEWVHAVGRRHGFTAAMPASAAAEGGAQAEDEALARMREHNARLRAQLEERRERANARAAELRAQGMEVEVQENPDGSIVVVGEGERPDGPLARMREHNARLQAQLEERRRRVEAQVAELRAQGFDARVQENPDGSIVVTGERDRIPASSREETTFAELDAEARGLFRRAAERIERMRTAVDRSEHVDLLNRINGFNGRLNDPANAEDPRELRRVIVDLRELIADVEARSREVDRDTDATIGALADGTAGPETPARRRRADDTDQASGREDASHEDLSREARRLFRRAVGLARDMQSSLGTAERREQASRLNTFNGRLNDPALRGDAPEMRRVVTDLRAAIQDLERRARELARSPGTADRGVEEAAGDPRENASARAEVDVTALEREAEELHRRATSIFERVAGRLDERELLDLRRRSNAIRGQVRDPANRGDAQELRRAITDLRALLADLQARERELGRGASSGR